MQKLLPITIIILVFLPSQGYAATPPSTNGTMLTVVAYALLWVIIALYLTFVGRRQRRLDHELRHLRKKIDRELGLFEDHEG